MDPFDLGYYEIQKQAGADFFSCIWRGSRFTLPAQWHGRLS